MATSILTTQQTQANKKLQRSITNVNPNASASSIMDFVEGLNNLSTNTLTGVRRVDTTELLDDTRLDRNLQFSPPYANSTIASSAITNNVSDPIDLFLRGNGITADQIRIRKLNENDTYVFADWFNGGADQVQIVLVADTSTAVSSGDIEFIVPATDTYKEGSITLKIIKGE